MNTVDYAKAGQVDLSAIPIINLEGYDTPDGKAKIAKALYEAATNTGFFYLSGHGIAPAVQAQALQASKRFFALDHATKSSISVNHHQRGWMAAGMTNLEGAKTHDNKEVFFWGYDVDADDPDVTAGMPMVAPNQWPKEAVQVAQVTPDASFLKRDLMPYYLAVLDLSRKVLSALALGLGRSPDTFTKAYEKPLGRGQLVYYPEMTEGDFTAERFGAAAHSDFGVLTILMQDQLGGLQIAAKDGSWIEAPPIPNTFVCNIGDLLEIWTGGVLKSTVHRVINRANEARYSIPIFCDPASDTAIDPSLFGVESAAPIITAGEYIAGKNKRNFSQYKA